MFELDMALILFSHFVDHLISFGAFHTARSFVPFLAFAFTKIFDVHTKKGDSEKQKKNLKLNGKQKKFGNPFSLNALIVC